MFDFLECAVLMWEESAQLQKKKMDSCKKEKKTLPVGGGRSACTLEARKEVLSGYWQSPFIFLIAPPSGSWPPALKPYPRVVFGVVAASPQCTSRPELFRLQHLLL